MTFSWEGISFFCWLILVGPLFLIHLLTFSWETEDDVEIFLGAFSWEAEDVVAFSWEAEALLTFSWETEDDVDIFLGDRGHY